MSAKPKVVFILGPLEPTDLEPIKERLDRDLTEIAMQKGIVKREADLVKRDLFPEDLGFTGDWSKEFTATGFQAYVSDYQLPDDVVIGFYGYDLSDPRRLVSRIKYYRGKGKASGVFVDLLILPSYTYAKFKPGLFAFSPAPIYENKAYVNIDYYILKTGTVRIGHLGRLVGPKDKYTTV